MCIFYREGKRYNCNIDLNACEDEHRPHMMNAILEEKFLEMAKHRSL